jgi:membrane protein
MSIKKYIKQELKLITQALTSWIDDAAPSMGAALSYYTLFSMAPLLLIVMSVAGFVFGAEAARGELFGQLRGLMGDEAAKTLESLLATLDKPGQNTSASMVGFAFLLIGATSVFGELQNALDRIWRVPTRVNSGGVWKILRARILSLGMILGFAFLLMVSLVAGAAVSAVSKWWGPIFQGWETLAQIVNVAFGFVISTAIFAMIYKLMPRAQVRWKDVWIGALVTSVLFTIGKYLIGLYIGTSGIASGFGAAGSIAVILVWVYYSAQIFLIGAEFTWVYARTYGSMRASFEERNVGRDESTVAAIVI